MFTRYLSKRAGSVRTVGNRDTGTCSLFREETTAVRIDGPPVILAPATAQAIAVALHELATNAAKYGSLSANKGQVNLKVVAPVRRSANRALDRDRRPARADAHAQRLW